MGEKKVKYTKFQDIPGFTHPGSYAVDYPLDHLVRWIREEQETMGLDLEPPFQRGHVWTTKQQQRYMEFLLRGGRTGRDLYFNCPDWRTQQPAGAYKAYVCVDGLQRITAIMRFIDNDLKVFGSYYREYEDSMRLVQDTMRVHINDLKTEAAVLQWYIDMNAGGTPHSSKEINRVQQMLDDLKDKR